MELIKVRGLIATREPLPEYLDSPKLLPESLADLSWTDPQLGLHGVAWWPADDQSPALGENQRYGAETLTPDLQRRVVVVVRAIENWAPPVVVPQRVPMLNAHLVLIEVGWMPALRAYLGAMPGTAGELARAYFDQALTMARDHPFVLSIPAALGKTEVEVDQLFVMAEALDV